jgi:hypothetical protein
METYTSIDEKIKNMQNEKIIPVKSNTVIGYILLTIGLLLFILGIIGLIEVKSINTTIIIIGLVLLCYAIFKIIKTKKSIYSHYIYEPTGKKLKKFSIYLDLADMNKLEKCIESKNYSDFKNIKKEMNSPHLLVLMGTDDGAIFLIQPSEYIPYNYHPTSDVIVLYDKDAKIMLDFVKS